MESTTCAHFKHLGSFACVLFIVCALGMAGAHAVYFEPLNAHVDAVEARIEQIKVEKRNVNVLLRSGKLGSKTSRKGEGLVSDADVELVDLRKFRKKLQRGVKKILKAEIEGTIRPSHFKLIDQLDKSYYGNIIQSQKIVSRLSIFVEANQITAANFGGKWNTNFGTIVFAQFDDDTISATYFWSGGGTVSGMVQGKVFRGSYSDATGSGTFKVIMHDGGNSWSGNFVGSDGKKQGSWQGSR